MSRVNIIGAGLAGSLLAIYLAKRGMEVDVFEARGDMRLEEVAAGRSINLALSDRGIGALREVGMDGFMLAEAVPMYGRMIHSPSGEQKLLPYSGRKGEYINSVSRAGLNIALLDEAEKYPQVKLHFNEPCRGYEAEAGKVLFAGGKAIFADVLMATDGAGSVIRQSMEDQVSEFHSSSVFLDHGYKELHIPAGDGGDFQLQKNALHIWPRHQFMMIALPNIDGSFTCTLFLAKNGPESFEGLSSEAAVTEFFDDEFSDAFHLMPTLLEDFFQNPIGDLGTVQCSPWHIGGKGLLLGDAAHAMVPFYGQGMNCAFEDVRVLDSLLSAKEVDWEVVFREFSALRKPNADAIQEMAEENFYEMRDRVADRVFQRKRELETKLEQNYPEYFSKYSMVAFRENMPYAAAKAKGNAQDAFLMEFCRNLESVANVDLDELIIRMKKEITV